MFLSLATCYLGCIPKVHILTPGLTGTVIDATSGKTIAGASILDRRTNDKGDFTIPAKKELGLTFLFVGGHYVIETHFAVSAPGYETRTCRCSVVTPTSACGRVRIPLQKPDPAKRGDKAAKGQIVMLNLDNEEPLEGGITCSPLRGETTIMGLEDDARNGSDSALYLLGIYYLQGINVEKDVPLGRYYLRQAAEAGNRYAINFFFTAAREDDTEAEVLIGDLLSLGLGIEQNISEALIWYEIAANNGDPIGMLRLAEMYGSGEIIQVDKNKSLYWYRQATETGSADAMYKFAEQCRYGIVTPPNLKQAIHWHIKAADAGSVRAYDFLLETIAAKEISAAEKHEALEWQAKQQ